jgi:exoribonuclease R
VYLDGRSRPPDAERVLPLLPRVLSEQLCSLNPHTDRCAFSVEFDMNLDGTLMAHHEPRVFRSMINSAAKVRPHLLADRC